MSLEEKIFWEVHSNLPQQGPGSDRTTLKALSFIPDLPELPRVLDIGCGPGRQTLALTKVMRGDYIAIDNHQPFLDELNARAVEQKVENSIQTICCSMDQLPFDSNSFDLIWSEGALYVIGIESALKYLSQFLRPKGYLAFTEIAFLKDDLPEELRRFWQSEYPPMGSSAQNQTIIEECGYELIESFAIDSSDWYDYYEPIENRLIILKKKYGGNEEANQIIEIIEREIEIYREYGEYYGYIFYIIRSKS